jgi:GT2 family glycosyltransferase/glycosyltransferase involved in cell wall biosynthesis
MAGCHRGSMRRRVLILDFDFHTSVGGGQVFYRRVVERNPAIDFYYPSAGADLAFKRDGKLPANVQPFLYDPRLDVHAVPIGEHWLEQHFARQLYRVAAATQGMTFQAVDVPSFFPVAHLVRPILTAHGVLAERVAVALNGWQSVSVKAGYSEADSGTLEVLERSETQSVECADARYTISTLEQAENAKTELPVHLVEMKDAIEYFGIPAPMPPGQGVPDLWYVGRLDGAKGPDIFIDIVSRIPRSLYGRCCLAGPDNTWSPTDRWSEHVLEVAKAKSVQAVYAGVPSDAEVRDIYRGRTVIVVPSRTDAFNYVSLEAILSGCPILLSERAGSLGFLRTNYPHLAPAAMTPDDVDAAASTLRDILVTYDDTVRNLRRTLMEQPFPAPQEGFMEPVYFGDPAYSPAERHAVGQMTITCRNDVPLTTPAARDWQPRRVHSDNPKITVVIPTLDRPALLAPTLACLTRQTLQDLEVIVVDDGGKDAAAVRAVAEAFAPMTRYVRIANAGEAGAVNRGIALARGEYVSFLSDDDAYAPELLAEAASVLDENPNIIGTYPDWDIVDTCGYFVEAHRLPEYDRKLLIAAHWCLPGPGVVIRRKVLNAIGGRDLAFRFVSDFDLWLRATAHGDMKHLPHKLAYWRLHATNLTTSDKRVQMAEERMLLLKKFYRDPEEAARSSALRHTAFAAAHLAAAAILSHAEPERCRIHLREAENLDPDLLRNLPANMAAYPSLWPA